MSEVLDDPRLSVTRIPELGRKIRARDDLIALWRLVREFRDYRPDIVHTHTAKAGALGRAAARLARIQTVVHTYHGHVFEGYFNTVTSRSFIAVERALGRITDAVVTISPRQRRDIVEKFAVAAADRVHVIPLGFDLSRFVALERHRGGLHEELRIPREVPIIASIARLTMIKDHALLLRAFALVERTSHLLLVGDGDEAPRLRALARDLGVSERVHFLGYRTDIERILADTAVVALTSKNEGTPVALIEGLAAGCLAVATDVGGVSDVLEAGRYGTLVPTRSPANFALALDTALDKTSNPEQLEAHVQAARHYAYPKYDSTRLLSDHATLYGKLLSSRR